MSRKNSGHFTIQLEPDEACVVLEKKFWDHMIQWYSIMAGDCTDPNEKADWQSVITAVSAWVENTYYDPKSIVTPLEYADEDDWN